MERSVSLRKLHRWFTLSLDLKALGHARKEKVLRGEETGCTNPHPAGQNLEHRRNRAGAACEQCCGRKGGCWERRQSRREATWAGTPGRRKMVFWVRWEAIKEVSSAQPSYLAMFAPRSDIFIIFYRYSFYRREWEMKYLDQKAEISNTHGQRQKPLSRWKAKTKDEIKCIFGLVMDLSGLWD